MAKVSIINGVNLGRLGKRRPEVYGSRTLGDIESLLGERFPEVEIQFRQTDYEGEFVGWIHESGDADALIVNPGAWSHYSYAIHDALESATVPKVEVHISNIHAREEEWRRHSVVSPVVDAVIAGMGVHGYSAAMSYVVSHLKD